MLLVLFSLSTLVIFANIYYSMDIKKQTLLAVEKNSVVAQNELEHILGTWQKETQLLAEDKTLAVLVKYRQHRILEYLQQNLRYHTMDYLAIVDNAGNILAERTQDNKLVYNYEFIQQILDKNITIADFELIKEQGYIAIAVATPIFYKHERIGILFNRYLLTESNFIETLQKQLTINEIPMAAIIKAQKKPLFLNKKDNTASIIRQNQHAITAILPIYTQQKYHIANLHLQLSKHFVYSKISWFRWTTIKILCICLIITTLISILIIRHITGDIERLMQGVEKITHGDLSHRVVIRNNNELNILAKAFNLMSEQLHNSIDELKENVQRKNEKMLESSATLKAILDMLPEALIVFDQENRLIKHNKMFVNMFVPDNNENLLYQHCRELFDEDISHLLEKSRELENSIQVAEIRFGDNRYGKITATLITPDYSHEDSLQQAIHHLGAIVLIGDKTDQKRMEQKLLKAKHAAESANRAKSAFLANISHELRTPLNAILGYAQLLECDRHLNPEYRNMIKIIHNSGDHLLMLINDVLDLAKIESGRIELNPSDINFINFIDNICDLFILPAQEKNINFSYYLANELPQIITADEKCLRQILINLLGNALKFTDKGKVNLHIEQLEDKKLRFSVIDTGCGISTENLEKIFNPFEQAGDQDKKVEGTGLGLAISKKMAEMMGGDLQVKSSLKKGSTFWFDIYLESPSHSSPTCQKIDTSQCITGYQEDKILHILIVDDDKTHKDFLFNLLKPLGFKLLFACTAKSGIQLAKDNQPDCIIMDIMMPDLTGIEAIELLKQEEISRNIPIIANSANVFEANKKRSLAAGAQHFISKPIDVTVLLKLLEQVFNLTWDYDDIRLSDDKHQQQKIPLAQHIAQQLYDAADVGDIEKIDDYIRHFRKNETYQSWSHYLIYIRQRNDMTALKTSLEAFL